jgi:SulP family sulfate permease
MPESLGWRDEKAIEEETSSSVMILQRSMPRGILSRFSSRHRLQPGDYLCKEGDPSDGFYFIHRGAAEVIKGEPEGAPRTVAEIRAPTLTGELGFFTGKPRTASIRALDEMSYTHFSGSHYDKLKKSDPNEAASILMASAQLAIHMMLHRS